MAFPEVSCWNSGALGINAAFPEFRALYTPCDHSYCFWGVIPTHFSFFSLSPTVELSHILLSSPLPCLD